MTDSELIKQSLETINIKNITEKIMTHPKGQPKIIELHIDKETLCSLI